MEALTHTAFGEIAVLLVLAASIGLLGTALRQPLVVGFIAVGLLAGSSGLDVVRADGQIDLLAELGITVLLFLVGIKLDVKLIRSLGAVALLAGLGQVILTTVLGHLIGLGLGLEPITSLYVAVALAFSSTIIIVKLLSDKREIDALHGQIALGFLIVQDLVVVLAMIVLSAIGIGAAEDRGGGDILTVLGSGLGLVALTVLFVRYGATPLTERLARAPELLLIFAIAQATLFAAIGDFAGLGKEVGGLLAGISLASTPYRETIAARLAPLRDFLLLFFFIALGAALDPSLLGANLIAAIVLALFVLLGKPLIVLAILSAMGYSRRTAASTGITLAQISEFSLIFIAMGVGLGHVEQEALGLVTLIGLVTIALSTYMITYSHRLYAWCEPLLGVVARRGAPRERSRDVRTSGERPAVILFGLGRFGAAIAVRLQRRGVPVLGVDFNPQAVRRCRGLGIATRYGDATDPEFIADLPLAGARWLVSTTPSHATGVTHDDARAILIQLARGAGFGGRIAVTSHRAEDTEALRALGVDLVVEPFQDAADRAVELLAGAEVEERIEIPPLETEQRPTP